MRWLLVPALVALPALYAWWGGRRLVRRLDDAALPERYLGHRMRVAQVGAVAAAVLLVLLSPHWVWGIPAMFVLAQAASLPSRRAILGETWRLRAYLGHVVRLTVAGVGFWFLLAFTPALIPDLGPMRWPIAVVLAAALFAWLARYAEAFLALTRATPLQRPDLAARLGEIAGRSAVTLPRLRRIGAPGGRLANAFALPSLRGSTVVFTDTLLEQLAAEEAAAIFAHEIAHLEHFDRRRLLLGRMVVGAAILAATVAVPLGRTALGLEGTRLDWVWALVVLLALAIYGTQQRAHEAESDTRAVALSGDAEALVRALVKLHALARLPRRWDPALERSATHPSLARRIQAIRAAAGAAPGALAKPLALRSPEPGRRVVLDDERVHWLEGVPEEAADEGHAARERAGSVLSVPYRQLTELRLRAALAGAPRLVATDVTGRNWSLPLRGEDVAAAQAALDVVEARLAAPASGWAHHPALAGLLSTASVLAALVAGQFGPVLVPATIGMFRASQATLAALGATAVATALLQGRREEVRAAAAFTPAALAALAVFGVLALVVAARRARAAPERRTHTRVVTAAALGVVAALSWASFLAAAAGAPRALRLHQAALGRPGAAIALLGLGTTLLFARRRAVRALAVACALLAMVPVVAGSRWFLLRFARDPFLAHPPALASRAVAARPVREARIGSPAAQLRLSPSRSRFAVRPIEPVGLAQEPRPASALSVRSFSGPEREVTAEDLRFLNDLRVLALVRLPSRLELRAVSLDDARDVTWSEPLPDVRAPRLELDTGLGVWQVTGTSPDGRAAVVLGGRLYHDGYTEQLWPLLEGRGGALPPVFSPQAALGVRFDVDAASMPLLPLAAATALPVRSELWALASEGPRQLAVSGLEVRCAEPALGHADTTFTCLAYDGRRTLLWSVDAAGATLEPLGWLPGHVYAMQPAPPQRVIGWTEDGLVWIDPAGRTATWLRLPGDAARPSELVPAGDALGALAATTDGALVTVYQIEPE